MQGSRDSVRVRSGRPPRRSARWFALLLVPSLAGCTPSLGAPTTPPRLAERAAPSFDSSGFAEGPGRQTVIAQCTGCHSGRLVQQNRATRDGWENLIRWMQKKQGLWKLSPHVEAEILNYLATYYGRATEASGRRLPLAANLLPPDRTARRAHETQGEKR